MPSFLIHNDAQCLVPTLPIDRTVRMILSTLVAISCLVSPILLEDEMVRKRLVRRRKQNWGSEEHGALSPRHISPVKKVFKRKIISSGGEPQKQLVRRKVMPHILPDVQNVEQPFSAPNKLFSTNQSISSYSNKVIPTKPMDAKRCKFH